MIGTGIELAADLLRRGAVVAIPTETVYGLAANALNEDAVVSIFKIKNRPFFDPLIVHTNSMDKIKDYVKQIPENALKLAEKFWPGPLTLLLSKNDKIPDIVTSGSDLLAIRIPSHPLTLSLLELLEFPLAAPSANPFGYISPTRAEHVEQQLGRKIPYILDGGESGIGLESTIVDCSRDKCKILRLGGLSIKDIENCLGYKVDVHLHQGSNPSAPGQLDKHYSPHSRFLYTDSLMEAILRHRHEKIAILTFGDSTIPDDVYSLNLSQKGDIDEAAKNLFHYMRLLDAYQPDIIIASKLPEIGLGSAINDRLKRASAK